MWVYIQPIKRVMCVRIRLTCLHGVNYEPIRHLDIGRQRGSHVAIRSFRRILLPALPLSSLPAITGPDDLLRDRRSCGSHKWDDVSSDKKAGRREGYARRSSKKRSLVVASLPCAVDLQGYCSALDCNVNCRIGNRILIRIGIHFGDRCTFQSELMVTWQLMDEVAERGQINVIDKNLPM